MSRRVMLWGSRTDEAMKAVWRELVRHRVPHLLLDEQNFRQLGFEIDTTHGVSGTLSLENERVDVAEVGAIYLRPQLPDAQRDAERHLQARELRARLFVWTDIAAALVLNRPSAATSNDSKPYQAELIHLQGFKVPPTLVTTCPQAVREFASHHGRVIYKSTSAMRSIVSHLDAEQMEYIDDVVHCATQFQAHIAGTDYRVHVIGDEVFASEIRCTADDYRVAARDGAALKIRAVALPPQIAERCHALAHALDLPLAGIDLRRTDDDEWYCFEVNPSPVFTFYESLSGQPLTAAVVQLLINAREGLAA